MDRLKPGWYDSGRVLPANLHSNMDRLKHLMTAVIRSCNPKFTFQYG